MVLIWLLISVQIVKKEVEVAKAKGQPLSPAEILIKSGEAAETILSSGSIWASLLGADATGKLVAPCFKILERLSTDSSTHQILKSLIQSGTATLGTFLGWELGSELFQESIEMLPNDSDRARVEDLLPKLFSPGASTIDARDCALMGQVMQSMFKILVVDDDLRNTWLYNAWRNHIATGDFVTMVTAMATSSAVGTMMVPGAGTLTGMLFGCAGGLLTLAVSEQQKDDLTDVIQTMRASFWKAGDDRGGLFDYKRSITSLLMNCIPQHVKCPPLLRYGFKPGVAEELVTIQSDRIWRYDSRLHALLAMRDLAAKNHQTALIEDYGRRISDVRARYRIALFALRDVYHQEVADNLKIFREFHLASLMTADNLKIYPQLREISTYLSKITALDQVFTQLCQTGLSSMENPSDDYIRTIYRFSFFRFSEVELFRTLAN